MSKREREILVKLYNDFINPKLKDPLAVPKLNTYHEIEEVKIIKALLAKGILNSDRCRIMKFQVSTSNDNHEKTWEEEIVQVVSKGKTNENIFTTEGEVYYSSLINSNWYKRLQEKAIFQIIRDLGAFIGFILGLLLLIYQILEYLNKTNT